MLLDNSHTVYQDKILMGINKVNELLLVQALRAVRQLHFTCNKVTFDCQSVFARVCIPGKS